VRAAAVLLAAVLLAGPAARGSVLEDAVRTSASEARAAFVSVGGGARPVGMGEAFVAVADDASAVTWNPGGLGQIRDLRAVASHDLAGADVGISYGAFAIPVGPGTIGVGLTALMFGSYDLRSDDGTKLGTDSITDIAGTLSYGFANPGWLGGAGWTGAGIEAVQESAGGMLVGVSLGGLYPAGESFTLGWAVQHLGPAKDGFSLPAVVKAGGAWRASALTRVALDAGYPLVSRQPTVAAGVEVSPHRAVALRAGYRWRGTQSGLSGLTGLTAGLGVRLGNLGVDYAYQPFGDLAVSHRFAIVWGVAGSGAVRGDEGGGASGPAPDGVDRIYREAKEAYAAKRYEDARQKADAVVQQDPGHWQAWSLLGNSYYALGDRQAAFRAYDRSLAVHPNNPKLKDWIRKLKAGK